MYLQYVDVPRRWVSDSEPDLVAWARAAGLLNVRLRVTPGELRDIQAASNAAFQAARFSRRSQALPDAAQVRYRLLHAGAVRGRGGPCASRSSGLGKSTSVGTPASKRRRDQRRCATTERTKTTAPATAAAARDASNATQIAIASAAPPTTLFTTAIAVEAVK